MLHPLEHNLVSIAEADRRWLFENIDSTVPTNNGVGVYEFSPTGEVSSILHIWIEVS